MGVGHGKVTINQPVLNEFKKRPNWDSLQVLHVRRGSGYCLHPPGKGNGCRDATNRGKCSEKEPGLPLRRCPPPSSLSCHLQGRRGAEAPAKLRLQTPSTRPGPATALTAEKGLPGGSRPRPGRRAPREAREGCPQPSGSPEPPAPCATAPGIPDALLPRRGPAPTTRVEPAPRLQRFQPPCLQPSRSHRSFRSLPPAVSCACAV